MCNKANSVPRLLHNANHMLHRVGVGDIRGNPDVAGNLHFCGVDATILGRVSRNTRSAESNARYRICFRTLPLYFLGLPEQRRLGPDRRASEEWERAWLAIS